MAKKIKTWKIDTLYDLDYGEKTEKRENETQTLYELEYGKKHWKTWKMRKKTHFDLEYGEKHS